jgi:intracellular sulfur oxidation DsrE/DsrF family protein
LSASVLLGAWCSTALAQAPAAFDPGVARPAVAKDHYAGSEKAVYHISSAADERGYMVMMANVRNHVDTLEAAGVKPDIRVVLNGDGLKLLTLAKEVEFEATARLPGAITNLRDRGVTFEICYITLIGFSIKLSDLYEAKAEDVVQSGVAEVGRLQARGYRLVKP